MAKQMRDPKKPVRYSVAITPQLKSELDRRRKEWGLSSRGEVLERLLGWMVQGIRTRGSLLATPCGYVAAAGSVQAQPQQLPQIKPIKRN